MTVVNHVKKGQEGSILVMAVILSFATIILGLAFLAFASRAVLMVDREISIKQDLYAAIAGNREAYTYARIYQPGSDQDFRRRNYYGNVDYSGGIIFGGYGGGVYSIKAKYLIYGEGFASPYSGNEYKYRVTTSYDHETFADYLYLTHRETDMIYGYPIYFWTPDTLDGKVHSNDVIHIHPWEDRPVFKKRVTSSASYIDPPNNHARFDEGLFLSQPEIYFPDAASEVRAFAGGGYTFATQGPNEVFWLAFLGSAFKVRFSTDRGNTWVNDWDELPLIPLPAAGAIFVDGKCWVSTTQYPDSANPRDGRLDGRVTVASSDTLYIRGQTLYACFDDASNTVPEDCDDALGLISEKWVLVSDRLPSWHYGIKINAGIAALRGSFSVDKVYGNAHEHQSLFVYGSLAQFHRGIVHTGSCGSGNGYCQKDYKYDERFRTNPPPHFIPIDKGKPVYAEDFFLDYGGE